MAKELQSNEYLKKDFISNVSHEFKTPLSVIRGYAKLLSEDDIEGVQRKEYATLILKESERLSDLASNILRLSKIDNQELVVKRSKFLLDEQIRQAVLLLEPKWKKKDVRFDIGLDKTFYEGDEELLSQVWVNLLDNAIKFIHENGKIDIEMLHMPGAVCVKISDNGIGMDAYTRERIFEHFFQGDFSHSKEGNGLGLSIVRRIVELHGGKIEVQSEPGKGSVFEVWLPAQKEDSSKVKRPAGARQ
jgi:signal transduction histidine kinase